MKAIISLALASMLLTGCASRVGMHYELGLDVEGATIIGIDE